MISLKEKAARKVRDKELRNNPPIKPKTTKRKMKKIVDKVAETLADNEYFQYRGGGVHTNREV